MELREATTAEHDALVGLLVDAADRDGRMRLIREQLLATPELAHHLAGWPRPDAPAARTGAAGLTSGRLR